MSTVFPATTSIDQARDWYLTVTYADSTGTPINITGYTAAFALAQTLNSSIVLSLTTGSGITITGSTGVIALHATSTQTAIDAGQYRAELVITSPSGVETSLLKGQIAVTSKVV
jgi:acetylglutamate kinase